VRRALLLMFVAACANFEDPAVVADLRPLAVQADLPEQVIDIDATTTADQVLAQLRDTHVTFLISDLNFDRRIRWSAEVCNVNSAGRCDHDAPYETLGSGVWDDPDTSPAPSLTIPADGNLLGILYDELQNDTLHGLGGEYFGISLRIGGDDADPDLDQYLAKEMLVSPRIPADRTPNQNPTMDRVEKDDDITTTNPLPLYRCGTVPSPLVTVAPGEKLPLYPIELPTTRETYSVPTIDGMTRTFTEAVTYQWLATDGKFSDSTTGGGHDPFGNQLPVDTTWTAPKDIEQPTDVRLWIIMRDERYGLMWYEGCVTVVP
jgi:hypothetical protein